MHGALTHNMPCFSHSELDVLKGNLQELYAAFNCCSKGQAPQLVANWNGTHFYREGVGVYGRLWSWLYILMDHPRLSFLGYNASKQQKLQITAKYTSQLFSQFQKQDFAAHADYEAALVELCKGAQVPESRLSAARLELTSWHSAVTPWIKFVTNDQSGVIVQGLKQLSAEEPSTLSFMTELALKGAVHVRHLNKMIALESRLQQSLPVLLLYKMAGGLALDKLEKEEAKKFCRKINKLKDAIKVRDFDIILYRLVDLFKKARKDLGHLAPSTIQQPDLATLELALIDHDCRLFLQKDEAYLQWRNSLKRGDKLYSGRHTYTLGRQIGRKSKPEEDRNIVFRVAGDRSIVLTFGVNRALLGIKSKIGREHSWGLKSVKYLRIDRRRRFAVMPRCHQSLSSIQWKSSHQLLAEDEAALVPIARLLHWFIEQEKTPLNFSADYLLFNKKGRLKCLKVVLEGPFDYNALVGYVIKCSNGNYLIYRLLIEPLLEHRYADFYAAIVENAAQDVPYDVVNVAAVHYIPDDGIIRQGQVLQEQIVALKMSCQKRLVREFDVSASDCLASAVQNAISSCYNEGCYVGFLPPSFEQEVIDNLLSDSDFNRSST